MSQKPTSPNSMRRIAAAGLLGTTVEFYDFFIFGTAAAWSSAPSSSQLSVTMPRRLHHSRPTQLPLWRGRSAPSSLATSVTGSVARPLWSRPC